MKIKRLSRKKIAKGYCFEMVTDRVVWPNRKVLKRDLIIHGGISVIVPVVDKKNLILIRQFRYGVAGYIWEAPAGTIAKNETPLACAKREISEEIGYKAKTWKKLGRCFTSPGYNTEIIHCFAASRLKETQTQLEEDEVLRAEIFSMDEVKQMINSKKIQDAKTLLALSYFFAGKNK